MDSSGIADDNQGINVTDMVDDCGPAISNNRNIPLPYPGRPVHFEIGQVNQRVGSNDSYVTSRPSLAGEPRYALYVSQLNAIYMPLQNVSGNRASAIQRNMSTFAGDPAVSQILFLVNIRQGANEVIGQLDNICRNYTSTPYLAPFNLCTINPYVSSTIIHHPKLGCIFLTGVCRTCSVSGWLENMQR